MSTTLRQIERETYVDLQALSAELVRLQETKRDYIVDTRRMTFKTDDAESFLTFDSSDPRDNGIAGGSLNEHAHGQVSARLKIPKAYYDRMRTDAPTLLDTNVQHWMIGKPETRMVRVLDGNVRALLGNGYRRLDNYDLMERAILPALADVNGLRFHVAALTPERMTIRALLPALEREVTVGDVVQAGVYIRNSEVGAGALEVGQFVWRLICNNGMVVPATGLRTIHSGKRIEDDERGRRIFAAETLRADDVAYFLKARDTIKSMFVETEFDLIVAKLREAATGEKITEPVAATERLVASFDLGETEGESVLRHLAEGGDLSQWGMANAVTAAAKDSDSFDRKHEVELAGWNVATMPARDWQKIAVAV